MKNVKKVGMGGFMCSSPASSSVCSTGDFAVIVPKRHGGRSSTMVDHSMLMTTSNSSSSNYSRLVESRRRGVSLGDKRSVTLSSALLRDRERERERISSRTRSAFGVASAQPGFQEVVMRVSIHCQGCAGKIKKHLSKMEGVTSFSIDVEAKRVTVMGHISPVGVLESISKVKKAEFWPCSQL